MKSRVISIKSIIMPALVIGIFAVSVAVFAAKTLPNIVAASSSERLIPIYNVDYGEKKVSISFDAAWGNDDTETLIDILSQYNVKTTFFVVGQWVDKYPESVKALSDAGHEIMNHSDTHPHMSQLSTDQILQEVNSCNQKIEQITGKCPTLLRAPYGEYNNTLINALDSVGMKCIQWDVDSLDWKDLSAGEITNRVVPKVKPGSIVLFHNAAKHTPEALPSILEGLQSQGYEIVPISQLIYFEDYTIDHAGKQIPNSKSGE